MEKHSEVFVAFDVAKKKHAVAIAEGGRTGEVRFLGDVGNSPLRIERTIKGARRRAEILRKQRRVETVEGTIFNTGADL